MSLWSNLRLGSRLSGRQYSWVISSVSVGPYPDSRLLGWLALDRVKAILDVSGLRAHHPGREQFRILKRPLIDGPGNTPQQFREAVSALERLVREEGRVYVHCVAGVNRAPSVVAAWLAWRRDLPLSRAIRMVRRGHPRTGIHPVIERLLEDMYRPRP